MNSFHNYGIKDINLKNYDVVGVSKDKFVDWHIIEKENLGLMFHPERYNVSQIVINKIIKNF